MFTRCPHCKAVHPLNAELLAQARGRMVCGRCNGSFNALRRLYDHIPEGRPGENDRKQKTPPVLGKERNFDLDAPAAPITEESRSGQGNSRRTWQVLLGAMLLVTVLNLAWTFRDSLPDELDSEPYRDPTRIHLVSRDIHPHPSRDGVLVLSATFVNLGEHAQPWPELSVSLKNEDNRPVAGRRFEPAEYLPEGSDLQSTLQPGSYVPILLEFADPGETAVGFELEFH